MPWCRELEQAAIDRLLASAHAGEGSPWSEVFTFVVRRLRTEPVVLLAAAWMGEGRAIPADAGRNSPRGYEIGWPAAIARPFYHPGILVRRW